MNQSILLFFVLFLLGCSQTPPKVISPEEVFLASLDSLYRWDIDKEPGGALMFLDVPYAVEMDCDTCKPEYLTLSVAKYDARDRPKWIAIILPDNIVKEEGVFLFFRKSALDTVGETAQDSTVKSIRVNLDEAGQETFTARLRDGYAVDEHNQQVDIFQKFLSFDNLCLMIFLPDGAHKTIAVPLHHFKEQYAQLQKERITQLSK